MLIAIVLSLVAGADGTRWRRTHTAPTTDADVVAAFAAVAAMLLSVKGSLNAIEARLQHAEPWTWCESGLGWTSVSGL